MISMNDQYICSECGEPAIVDHNSPPIRPCRCTKGTIYGNMQTSTVGLRPTQHAYTLRNETYLRTGSQLIGAACLLGEKGVRDEAYDFLLCFGCELLLKYRILNHSKTKTVKGIISHSLTDLYKLAEGNDVGIQALLERADSIYCNRNRKNKHPIRYADTISFLFTRLSDDDRDSLIKYVKSLVIAE